MAKKLTYDELSKKLFSMEEELRQKEELLRGIESNQYLGQRVEYLQGKVEVYERLMTWVEHYFNADMRGKE